MKYKILLPLLVSGLFLYACSKDDTDTTNKPGETILETYYPGSSMEIKELSIRTSEGTITDPAFIQDFINRNVSAEVKDKFIVGASSVPVNGSNQILYFLENSRVNVGGVNMQITGYGDSTMTVTEYTSTPFPSINTYCDSLLSSVPDQNPLLACPAGGCTSYRKSYTLITSGPNYYAPLLTYAVVTKNCVRTASGTPVISVISRDLNSLLTFGDSVLVQYAKLPLVKESK
ncbi:hypothetical protein [Longitalea luteola]|uniref:hypothetical protein n=1 Tax=Longitalea luteola TaxID=2812563 RepID=UPI001A97B461|nr:hypothetical protein [Longitalea luteola]